MCDTRIKQNMNSNWTFQFGDIEEAKNLDFDDSSWYHIGLPHSFGIPYFMENYFYVGYGCYRRFLDIPPQWNNKRLYLEFQGVFQETDVYINGSIAGSHKGGYTAFVIDITDFVQEGINLIFIKVNNLWNPKLAPRAGEHVFHGGIYRDVSLLVTENLHVAWYGTFIKTPIVSEEEAFLAISTEVENHTSKEQEFLLVSTVEYQGDILLKIATKCLVLPYKSVVVDQKGTLTNPKLWHPDTPELHCLKTHLYSKDCLLDDYETTFGIRWFSFTAKNGFFLNGKPYSIIGANVHQDHAGWADAVTHSGIRRDIKLIKDCGMNFIRGSHYPHHTVFADECDRQGILFWSELCFWGIGGFREDGYWNSSAYPVDSKDRQEFDMSCMTTLKEMIHTNRNHPSIIVWSMGNEVFFSENEVIPLAQNLVKRLVSLTHELDPTRPAASGGAQRGGFDLLGDIAGYNGDGASLYIDPGFPNFVSEYGSCISDRPGEYSPHFTDGVEKDPGWRCGKAIWCGFHHGSIADKMGHMGIIDYYRLPLASWYWYREALLGIAPPEPSKIGIPYGIKLFSDSKRIRTDGTEDAYIKAFVVDIDGQHINYSLPVTLTVIKGGALFPTGRTILLSPEKGNLIEGIGAIELRAFYTGEILVHATAEGLQEDTLVIIAEGTEEWRGQSLMLPASPPNVLIPGTTANKLNIARNRPVFSSSSSQAHSCININDGNPDTFWQAVNKNYGHWVMQDLEGIKSVSELKVYFRCEESVSVEILVSEDNHNFQLVAKDYLSPSEPSIYLTLKESFRYAKVYFPTSPANILNLEIYSI